MGAVLWENRCLKQALVAVVIGGDLGGCKARPIAFKENQKANAWANAIDAGEEWFRRFRLGWLQWWFGRLMVTEAPMIKHTVHN